MILARRLQDAWKVLWGRSEPQLEVVRIRAEWVEIQAQISNTFAILNKWAQRVAKQEQRALAASAIDVPTQELAESTPQLTDHKAELYRRAAALRGSRSRIHGLAPLVQERAVSLSSPPDEGERDVG